MARIINGMPADTPEEKKKAVELGGGTYNQNIEGDYVQGKSNRSKPKEQQVSANDAHSPNYCENIQGDVYEGDYVEGQPNTKNITKKKGWFW